MIDVPSQDFLHSLESDEKMRDKKIQGTALVIHYTDAAVFSSDRYQAWMKQFGHNTKHLVMNSMVKYMAHSSGIQRHQSILNMVTHFIIE